MSNEELYIQYLVETQNADPEYAKAYIAEMRATGKPIPGLDDTDWQEINQGQQQASSIGKAGFDIAGRVLDYADGLTRTPFTDFEASRKGYPDAVTLDDYKKALMGKAPDSATYLERMGKEPGLATAAEGFARDMAYSPANWASMGMLAAPKMIAKGGKLAKAAGAIQKADKFTNPLSNLTQKGGKAAYKSAFARTDARLAEDGLNPLSEVLWKHGKIRGNATEISDQADELGKYLGKARTEKFTEASKAGAMVDPLEASKRAYAELEHARRMDPYMTDREYNSLKEYIDRAIKPDPEAVLKRQIDEADYAQKMREWGKAKMQQNLAERKVGKQMTLGVADDATPHLTAQIPMSLDGRTVTMVDQTGLVPKLDDMMLPEFKGKKPGESAWLPPDNKGVHPAKVSLAKKGQAQEAAKFDRAVGEQQKFLEKRTTDAFSREGTQQPLYIPDRPVRPSGPLPIKKETIEQASEVKTKLRGKLPRAAYGPDGKLTDTGKKITKSLADGRQHQIVEEANKVRTGLGDEIADLNKDWGVLINSRPDRARDAIREANLRNITSLDAGGLVAAAATKNPLVISMGVGKKMGDIGRFASTKTRGGKALYDLGGLKIMDPLARRLGAEVTEDEREQDSAYRYISPYLLPNE